MLQIIAAFPEILYSLGQQATIEIEPHRGDMPVLLGPQYLSRPSNLQIAHGDSESGPQFAGFQNSFKSLLGRQREANMLIVEEIRVSLVDGSPDSSTKLVELRQAKAIGLIDDDRVHVGNIQTTLDDSCANQDIILTGRELKHHAPQLALIHLAVGHFQGCLGYNFLKTVGHSFDFLNSIVYEENLATSIPLSKNSLSDEGLIVFGDERANGQALLGRRINGTHVPYPREREM